MFRFETGIRKYGNQNGHVSVRDRSNLGFRVTLSHCWESRPNSPGVPSSLPALEVQLAGLQFETRASQKWHIFAFWIAGCLKIQGSQKMTWRKLHTWLDKYVCWGSTGPGPGRATLCEQTLPRPRGAAWRLIQQDTATNQHDLLEGRSPSERGPRWKGRATGVLPRLGNAWQSWRHSYSDLRTGPPGPP